MNETTKVQMIIIMNITAKVQVIIIIIKCNTKGDNNNECNNKGDNNNVHNSKSEDIFPFDFVIKDKIA